MRTAPLRAGARRPPTPEDVRLEVDRLEATDHDAGTRVLRASGRAWARHAVTLGVPVLVAGTARVAPAPGVRPVQAGPDGPHWVAEFRVPEPVAAAAHAWAVEVAVPTEPEGPAEPVGAAPGSQPRAAAAAGTAGAPGVPELRPLLARAAEGLARSERRCRAAESEILRLRAELEARSLDREELERRLRRVTAELDALRARLEHLRRDRGSSPEPPEPGGASAVSVLRPA